MAKRHVRRLDGMYELPASVRLALWATHAIRHGRPMSEAAEQALPDVDALDGALDRLDLWRDLGERAVCVDLPRPGLHGGILPPTSAASSAALEAGECIFVPSLGGCLVPRLEWYGPQDDQGLKLTLEPHDSDPVPAHRLEMLALPDIDRRFREALVRHIDDLERLDVQPHIGSDARGRADARLESARWALPDGMPGRAVHIIVRASTVAAALDEATSMPGGVDQRSASGRDMALRDRKSVV